MASSTQRQGRAFECKGRGRSISSSFGKSDAGIARLSSLRRQSLLRGQRHLFGALHNRRSNSSCPNRGYEDHTGPRGRAGSSPDRRPPSTPGPLSSYTHRHRLRWPQPRPLVVARPPRVGLPALGDAQPAAPQDAIRPAPVTKWRRHMLTAADVMTSDVITVTPDTSVREIAKLMYTKHISGVPVIDRDKRVIGIVGEGDLLGHAEIAGERHRTWWLDAFVDSNALARHYIKTHGRIAADVMTPTVNTV